MSVTITVVLGNPGPDPQQETGEETIGEERSISMAGVMTGDGFLVILQPLMISSLS